MCALNHVRLFATPWTVVHQTSLSLGFSRQEYWSGLPFPSPEDILEPGIEPGSPSLQVDSLPSELPESPKFINTLLKSPLVASLALPNLTSIYLSHFLHQHIS